VKTVLIASIASFAVGIGVGAIYALVRVKAPAPPIVALVGLLGIVIGEQIPAWVSWYQTSHDVGVDPPSLKAVFMESAHDNSRKHPSTR
jgi:XapX domain-containing protein